MSDVIPEAPIAISNPAEPANFNSYGDVAGADAYFFNSLSSDAWTDASIDNRNKGLITATRLLDATFSWKGTKTRRDQPLDFPRAGVFDEDGIVFNYQTLPNELIVATYETAKSLLKSGLDAFDDSGTRGIKKLAAGPLSIEFEAAQETQIVKDTIKSLLAPLIQSEESANTGFTFMRVGRS